MRNYRFIISGGGTGGHIFPAISIANTLKERYPNAEFLFVGAEGKMEMEKVPTAGYRIVGLPVRGFDRQHLMHNFSVVGKLIDSLVKARKVIRTFAPDVTIGVGGFASGPTLWIASSMGIPTLIQEQNSYAGVTNKLLSKKARRICVAYKGMERYFPKDRIVLTGNPVRKNLVEVCSTKNEALAYFGLSPDKPTILVVGGSLGARTINQSIQHGLDSFLAKDIQVIWQTGRLYYDTAIKHLKPYQTKDIYCHDFITRMDLAYLAADLVVSRAGASSISELCLLRKSVILVPSPNVAEDHQTKNAKALASKGAALLVTDAEAPSKLVDLTFQTLLDKEKLASLGNNIELFAINNSAERIVDEIEKLLKNKDNR